MAMPDNPLERCTNHEAEASLVGSVLLKASHVIPRVVTILGESGDAFSNEPLQIIYKRAVSLYQAGQPVDLVCIKNSMAGVDFVGAADPGSSALRAWEMLMVDLIQSVPSWLHAESYAGIMVEMYARRRVYELCSRTVKLLESGDYEADDILPTASDLVGISQAVAAGDEFVSFEDRKAAILSDRANKVRVIVATGNKRIDDRVGGIRKGQMCVLAARPSMGKTSLALSVAAAVAGGGGTVLFLTVEMPTDDMLHRLLALTGEENASFIMGDHCPDDRFGLLCEGLSETRAASRVYFNDTASTVEQVERAVGSFCIRKPGVVQLVVVDYLTMLGTRRPHKSKVDEVTFISRQLKMMARTRRVALLCLSQLNRAVEHRGGVPMLSDLRDSGAIEQDADQVWFLYRKPGDPDDVVRWYAAKNRNGESGIRTEQALPFMPASMKFSNSTPLGVMA